MASNTDMTCLMCLEAKDVLKMVGKCNHSFCMTCLSKHLESCKDSDGTFPCPTCIATCELPDGDIEKLVDVTRDSKAAAAVPAGGARPKVRSPAGAAVREKRVAELDALVDVKCLLCFHNKKVVKAKNLCVECDQLYLCDDCTAIHAQNKATKDHVVIPLVPKSSQEDEMCPTHSALLTKYCTDCGKAVCKLCIMLEHADHDIEKLTDIIEKRFEEVKMTLQQREGEVSNLHCHVKNLGVLKNIAKVVDKQDELVKEIEDHAQKRIDEIVTWKENLKEEVRNEFKVVRDIPEACDKAEAILKKLDAPIPNAAELVENRLNSPVYLDKLISVGKDLAAVPKMGSEIDGDGYRKSLRELHQRNINFSPSTKPPIGKIDKVPVQAKRSKIQLTETSSHKIDVDTKEKFIPCVANLGKQLAIAHPTLDGAPSDAINIYESPDKLCRTLRDGVDSVYDMAATSEGNLAVLSDGTDGTSPSSIKIFDPNSGDRLAVHNLDVPRPMSLAVSPENHSFILGNLEEGRRCITVVDDKGDKQYEHIMEIDPKVKDPSRISCGCWYVFVMGENGVGVYERQDTGLKQVHVLTRTVERETFYPQDISASIWDDLFLPVVSDSRVWILKYMYPHYDTDIRNSGYKEAFIQGDASGADLKWRISISGSKILLSHGQTFSVYDSC